MPFGLKNTPRIFQRKMDKIFFEYSNFIKVYIDDILICSENEDGHEKCDAPNPGCSLTTRQLAEYSWMSGNLPDTHENRTESPLYGELYPDTSPVPIS